MNLLKKKVNNANFKYFFTEVEARNEKMLHFFRFGKYFILQKN